MVLRFRIRHSRLNKHMYRIHLSPAPICSCGFTEQTVEHVLQNCPEYRELRRNTRPLRWPWMTRCTKPKRASRQRSTSLWEQHWLCNQDKTTRRRKTKRLRFQVLGSASKKVRPMLHGLLKCLMEPVNRASGQSVQNQPLKIMHWDDESINSHKQKFLYVMGYLKVESLWGEHATAA